MIGRRVIEIGSVVWAVVALSVGLATLGSYNSDAQFLVIAACIVGAGSAVTASLTLGHHHDRIAGTLLIVSVVAPTSFAWALNLPALLVGAGLVLAPSILLRDEHRAGV